MLVATPHPGGLHPSGAHPVHPAGTMAQDPAALCERAAAIAAREFGVPREIMLAIALTESGRARDGVRRPWPWTLNLGGPGFWFDNLAQAEARLAAEQRTGRSNIDIGCFQLNLRWHGAAFTSARDMFDPLGNARHAARFLRDLRYEFEDWNAAVGAYHSRTPERAERYRALFALSLEGLRRAPAVARARPAAKGATAPMPFAAVSHQPGDRMRENVFPLLQAGVPLSPGSLVPAAGVGPAQSRAPRSLAPQSLAPRSTRPGLLQAPLRGLGERG